MNRSRTEGNSDIKVLIINAWGSNRGDEAMINSLFRIVKTLQPHAAIHAAPFRDEDLDIDPGITILRNRVGLYGYSTLRKWLNRPSVRITREIMSLISKSFSVASWSSGMRFLKRYDLIISAPQGPTIGDLYKRFTPHILYPLQQARRYKVPYMILGVSMGPFEAYDSRIFDVFNHAERIVLREDMSLSYLQNTYPGLTNVETAIDMVFSHEPEKITTGGSTYEKLKEAMARHDTGWIGACISLTPARNPSNSFDRHQYLTKMASLFDYAVVKTNRNLLLFPHLGKLDTPALSKIKEGMAQSARAEIVPSHLDSDCHQDLMTCIDFFISSRYHPTIFAIRSGTAFLCIKNQFKVEGMLKKLRLDFPTCWQDDPLESLMAAFEACWTNRRKNRFKIEKAASNAVALGGIYRKVLSEFFTEA